MLPRNGPGTRLKTYTETFLGINIRKLSRNHVMSYFPHTIPWCATCSWKSISYKPTWVFSPGNTTATSNERNESFRQDISQKEKRYSSKWNPNMLADYCRTLVRETLTEEYKRQKTTKCFWYYIYLFLGRTLYIDTIDTFWTVHINLKIY
jgi:hypothetical protein